MPVVILWDLDVVVDQDGFSAAVAAELKLLVAEKLDFSFFREVVNVDLRASFHAVGIHQVSCMAAWGMNYSTHRASRGIVLVGCGGGIFSPDEASCPSKSSVKVNNPTELSDEGFFFLLLRLRYFLLLHSTSCSIENSSESTRAHFLGIVEYTLLK